jgi:hypothetical protein
MNFNNTKPWDELSRKSIERIEERKRVRQANPLCIPPEYAYSAKQEDKFEHNHSRGGIRSEDDDYTTPEDVDAIQKDLFLKHYGLTMADDRRKRRGVDQREMNCALVELMDKIYLGYANHTKEMNDRGKHSLSAYNTSCFDWKQRADEYRLVTKEKVKEVEESMPNKLIMKKLPSDTMTMLQIKNQIRKIISDGIKIDMVVLDYIDCVVPDKNLGDEWKSEGSVMRAFEAMCHEMDLVGWTATQGNRASISSEVVTTDQMGGSIKKAQVGHVIISVAKTLQQKELKLATIAITKSRIGDDGIVFENCKFDNAMIEIDTESSMTFLGIEEQKEERQRERVKELIKKRQEKESQKPQSPVNN